MYYEFRITLHVGQDTEWETAEGATYFGNYRMDKGPSVVTLDPEAGTIFWVQITSRDVHDRKQSPAPVLSFCWNSRQTLPEDIRSCGEYPAAGNIKDNTMRTLLMMMVKVLMQRIILWSLGSCHVLSVVVVRKQKFLIGNCKDLADGF